MLAFDSLVIDLIFQEGVELDPEGLLDALGGPEIAQTRKILDPDMQDPRFEMELSPSMPFRRRGERRLMIIDDSVAPMRKDPRTDAIVPVDLRPEKERLIAACQSLPVRLGRIFALGSWGDAVLVARNAVDLRAINLLGWVLDPMVDVDGKTRASRLSQADFEEKIAAYDKRLEELDEQQILNCLGTAKFERRNNLLAVDVLEADGTWDVRNSLALEQSLAAVDRFSLIPGARAVPAKSDPEPPPIEENTEQTEPLDPGKSLAIAEIGGRVVLMFPQNRFEQKVAAAMGRKDFDAVIKVGDRIPGPVRDRIHEYGAGFIAPLEFLSEVFVDGTPLSRPAFEKESTGVVGDVRGMEVHCPRYGKVMLIDIPDKGRFISSEIESIRDVVSFLQ